MHWPLSLRAPMARLAALMVVAAAPATAQTPPSIRAIEAAPFPSAMVASPQGDLVAWVHNTEGARSIIVAAAPAYAARRVVHFGADDGQEVAQDRKSVV